MAPATDLAFNPNCAPPRPRVYPQFSARDVALGKCHLPLQQGDRTQPILYPQVDHNSLNKN
ncbi:hypothetical protein [Nodosilinea sp. FACHB-13]|uniref:hypothetical protein n=1 Tax=Cyanophyceae TaxID=3028117 RepID=UPI001684B96F|nr:hypothetical protein [Nodosilinea sp. FACHB-13]MBD2110108.1 hypothetical protein [Nodosilinea sp. FACHB-13]